jgi:hypothetical protein
VKPILHFLRRLPHHGKALGQKLATNPEFRFAFVYLSTTLVMSIWPLAMLFNCGWQNGLRSLVNQATYSFFHVVALPPALAYFSVFIEAYIYPYIEKRSGGQRPVYIPIGLFLVLGILASTVFYMNVTSRFAPTYMFADANAFDLEVKAREAWRENPENPSEKAIAMAKCYSHFVKAAIDGSDASDDANCPKPSQQGLNGMRVTNAIFTFLVIVLVGIVAIGLIIVGVDSIRDWRLEQRGQNAFRRLASRRYLHALPIIFLMSLWFPGRIYADWYESCFLDHSKPGEPSPNNIYNWTVIWIALFVLAVVVGLGFVPWVARYVQSPDTTTRTLKKYVGISQLPKSLLGSASLSTILAFVVQRIAPYLESYLSLPVGQLAAVFAWVVSACVLFLFFDFLIRSYWTLEGMFLPGHGGKTIISMLRDENNISTIGKLCWQSPATLPSLTGVKENHVKAVCKAFGVNVEDL